MNNITLDRPERNSPGSPLIRTWYFHSLGQGSIPGWGTQQATWQGKKKKVLKLDSTFA